MKYMGSKRAMLLNGLGDTLSAEVGKAERFIDLFTGSGSVAWHVSSRWNIPVLACDLQSYAVCLAEAVLSRTIPVLSLDVYEDWISNARSKVFSNLSFKASSNNHKCLQDSDDFLYLANDARQIAMSSQSGPIMSAYGGYYFSPLQCLWIDALRSTLPLSGGDRALSLAALICTASRLAAAPGHTAQPFKPNRTAGPFLIRAWRRDVLEVLRYNIVEIGRRSALRLGTTKKTDALSIASSLCENDLAFIDPPYSAVQYSRFYHVLETLATSEIFVPEGEGRYPPVKSRPTSVYSLKAKARDGLIHLFREISNTGASAILTFPEYDTSIGLNGSDIEEIAMEYFYITRKSVSTNFSTLGGTKATRQARKVSGELILTLKSR